MSVELTNEKHVRPDKGKKLPNKAHPKPKVTLKLDNCTACGHIQVSNICVNKLCVTNKRSS